LEAIKEEASEESVVPTGTRNLCARLVTRDWVRQKAPNHPGLFSNVPSGLNEERKKRKSRKRTKHVPSGPNDERKRKGAKAEARNVEAGRDWHDSMRVRWARGKHEG